MIPYKFFDLNARDQTGVLLQGIHRTASKSQAATTVELILFEVPSDNALLLTSASVQMQGGVLDSARFGELNFLDKAGNRVSQLSMFAHGSLLTDVTQIYGACSWVGSPIAVVGPGMQIEIRGIFGNSLAANNIIASLNGVLIPRGTMAYQN